MPIINHISRTSGPANRNLNSSKPHKVPGPLDVTQNHASPMQIDGPTVPSTSRNTSTQLLLRGHPSTQPQHSLPRQHQTPSGTNTPAQIHQQPLVAENAVIDLLPFCTTGPPIHEEQIIALSDVAGSLKEVMMLALSASTGDRSSVDKLEGAVGRPAAVKIVEFFVDEWEID